MIKSGFCISRNCVENANPILSNRVEMQNFFPRDFFQLWNSSGVRLKKVGEWPCSTSSVSIMAHRVATLVLYYSLALETQCTKSFCVREEEHKGDIFLSSLSSNSHELLSHEAN